MKRRLFIANRGEIAARIARTAKALGYAVILPYVPSERRALSCELADFPVLIPPGGFLDGELLVRVAKRHQATHLHPGYGFLSESAAFAALVESSGIIFVGPTPVSMEQLGDKAAARELAQKLNIPVSAGYNGSNQDLSHLIKEARRLKFPLLIKAAAGGGGRGMRKVPDESALEEALLSARREAESAFGDGRLILERFFENARHVEVQIIGDGEGNCIHLYERDCTVQRRYQKLIEEAPAFGVSCVEALREAAVSLGKAVQIRGVSTVEFLVSGEEFIFLEVNTRLQVEHPVSEEILGLDLVALQLQISSGESVLPERIAPPSNHAIEVRIVAEDPYEHFRPSLGEIYQLTVPPGCRFETGYRAGDRITGEFDSLVAKVIVSSATRDGAIDGMLKALSRFRCVGIETNLPFLIETLSADRFRQGELAADLAEEIIKTLGKREPDVALAISALHALASSCYRETLPEQLYRVTHRGEMTEVRVRYLPGGQIELNNEVYPAELQELTPLPAGGFLFSDEYLEIERVFPSADAQDAAGEILSPLSGRILQLLVKPGDHVRPGDVVVVIDSMKMENKVKSPSSGIVDRCLVKPGDVVSSRQILIHLSSH
jgi:3-methylcrotonyl-CoA carboxylase alpha subunit